MTDRNGKYPPCFGDLNTVFPKSSNDLRNTPETCMACAHKTECLRSALSGCDGLTVREERVDRAYAAGMIGFLERWSQKKAFQRQKKKSPDSAASFQGQRRKPA